MAVKSSTDIAGAITLVEGQLATLGQPPRNWGVYNAQVDTMADVLRRDLAAVIRDGTGGAIRVRICGTEASSTMGLAVALRSWLSAARKRVARQPEAAL